MRQLNFCIEAQASVPTRSVLFGPHEIFWYSIVALTEMEKSAG
jgi:hypothetical protein